MLISGNGTWRESRKHLESSWNKIRSVNNPAAQEFKILTTSNTKKLQDQLIICATTDVKTQSSLREQMTAAIDILGQTRINIMNFLGV